MLKITDAVKAIVSSDEIARTALREGYLNLSAYAKSIKPEVEEKTKKQVKTGSIVITLSRLKQTVDKEKPLLPKVYIEDLSVKSALVEIAFDKTKPNLEKLKRFYQSPLFNSADFLVTTQGVGEITIFALEGVLQDLLKFFASQKPKAVIKNLAALTVRLPENYILIPNIIYALLKHFALLRLNIVEMVSTYTELTFLFDLKDLEKAFLTLHDLILQRKSGKI